MGERAALVALTVLLGACTQPVPHDTLPTAITLADQGVERWPASSLFPNWIQTVWAYGVFRLHAATGDPRWQDYYRAWMDAQLPDFTRDPPRSFDASDSMSPAILAAALMWEDPSVDLSPITEAADDYLAAVSRTRQGAIVHWSDESTFGPPDQVWIDSQFMFGVYLVHQYARTDDPAYLDLFVEQYLLFSELCRDEGDQLYRHAYDDVTGDNIPIEATYWARGNAWVLVAAAEALSVADDGEVEALFQAHAEALVAAQATDGLWHTVLNQPRGDDPANYTETSASALIAYGLTRGLRAGLLDEELASPAIARAVRGVGRRLDEEPDGRLILEGTSQGTNPGDYDYYVSVSTGDDLMLGLGTVVMMLAEVDGLEDPLSRR